MTLPFAELIIMPCPASLSFKDTGKQDASIILELAKQLLQGIHLLYQEGVAHCDIKPENIIIHKCPPIHLYIVDFDLVLWLNDSHTMMGFRGTDGWTAPKVGRGQFYNLVQADIWA